MTIANNLQIIKLMYKSQRMEINAHTVKADHIFERLIIIVISFFGKRSSEQQNMGLWFVNHVMDPALTLLDAQSSPFLLCH